MAFVLTHEQLLVDMHQAYFDARRHKRQKAYQLRFERSAEAVLSARYVQVRDVPPKLSFPAVSGSSQKKKRRFLCRSERVAFLTIKDYNRTMESYTLFLPSRKIHYPLFEQFSFSR